MVDISLLSRDELVAKVVELENVLTEFQESSRELELALEDELADLETKVSTLEERCALLDTQASKDRLRAQSLTSELESVYENHNRKVAEWNQTRTSLMQQLVLVEITNDTMENKDRAQQTQLRASQQLVNDLLEKLAIVEHDLERERANSASNQLYTTNYQNEVQELTKKLNAMEKLAHSNQDLLSHDSYEGDVLLISMRQVLLAGPPPASTLSRNYARLPSLQKIQELHRGVSIYMTRSALTAPEPSSSSPKNTARIRPTESHLPTSSTTGPSEFIDTVCNVVNSKTMPSSAHSKHKANDNEMLMPQLDPLNRTPEPGKKRSKRRLLELAPFRVHGRRSKSNASD